jgi:RNA polymerase sigma factor (TIGR02999 family)
MTTSNRQDIFSAIQSLDGRLVSQLPSQPFGELLGKWRAGDQQALQALVPLVYKELGAVAHGYLKRERPGHTLQTTALLHEAYLRLADQRPLNTENRRHFIGVAARLMRQILVDYARSRRGAKRGPDRKVAALAVPQVLRADTYDLGEDLRFVLLSITEGEDKPLKYPTIFNSADVAIITKSDLAAAVEFDEAAARRNVQAVRPGMEVFKLSAKTGEGIAEYLEFLEHRRVRRSSAASA